MTKVNNTWFLKVTYVTYLKKNQNKLAFKSKLKNIYYYAFKFLVDTMYLWVEWTVIEIGHKEKSLEMVWPILGIQVYKGLS